MTRTLRFLAGLTILILASTLVAQEQGAPKELVGEGIVVAFQKDNRHPVMGPVRGVAHFAEFWIVRIDKWTSEVDPFKEKYFRVEYNIYERGLTDCEINATRLRFKLRERRENEHTDCMGTQREPSDYLRTTPGQPDSIPTFASLPCLIADQAPTVIPE
ncbi:MAG TPA: hypothetical protein VJP89_18630 [Pyrinomonadaceae bacterium]|nr:hypothetical protein [Pyrinomonadaceae bacterium]